MLPSISSLCDCLFLWWGNPLVSEMPNSLLSTQTRRIQSWSEWRKASTFATSWRHVSQGAHDKWTKTSGNAEVTKIRMKVTSLHLTTIVIIIQRGTCETKEVLSLFSDTLWKGVILSGHECFTQSPWFCTSVASCTFSTWRKISDPKW